MKVVVNKCYGGFGLSDKGGKRYLELGGKGRVGENNGMNFYISTENWELKEEN